MATPYRLLADAVLLLHVGVVLFVVGGLAVVLLGNRLGWRWVNGRVFRGAHLGAIGVVVAEAWFGIACPLTTLEDWLRGKDAAAIAAPGTVGHWLQRLLFYDAAPWVFTLAYTLFGLAVAAAWWRWPPRPRRRA